MRIFDPHIHMFSRVTDDYQHLAEAGVRMVLEPAFWLGQNRTNVGSFVDYFDTILGWERFRAEGFGIHHRCTMALNPREANDSRFNDEVLAILPRYLEKDGCVGVGEIGFDDQTEVEERGHLPALGCLIFGQARHQFRVHVPAHMRDPREPVVVVRADPDAVEFVPLEMPKKFFPPEHVEGESWSSMFYSNLVHNFMEEIIQEGSINQGNFAQSAKVQEIINAIELSNKDKRWINLPLP